MMHLEQLVAIDVHVHAERNTNEAGMGRKRLGNDEVLQAARDTPDVLIPFASVDPHKGSSPSARRAG